MAGTIRMTPEELRTCATELDVLKNQIMDELKTMKSKVDSVCSNWEGAAQNSFVDSFETLYNQINEALPTTVEGIEGMLNGAADGIEQADEQIASKLKM